MKNRKSSIVSALREKGFSKRAANNIAKSTLRKSSERRAEDHACNWKKSMAAHDSIARNASAASEKLHRQAAINKSTMAGKVVVVNRSISTNERKIP